MLLLHIRGRSVHMASELAWLGYDSQERDRTNRLLDAFKEQGSVDELGIGQIRDAITGVLFPGTSVLQTRARYFFFVPWHIESAMHERTHQAAIARLRSHEAHLIDALLVGGETRVIGSNARWRLKRMPSVLYWAGLAHYRLRTTEHSISGLLRDGVMAMSDSRARAQPDGEDDPAYTPVPGLDATVLALPRPPGWPQPATITYHLSHAEADYLRERIQAAYPDSLFAWYLRELPRTRRAPLWEQPASPDFPDPLAEWVDHGRRFDVALHGAAILYNLLLARQSSWDEGGERYESMFADWMDELADVDALNGWDIQRFWALLGRRVAVRTATRAFVDRWLDLVASGEDLTRHPPAERLIRTREQTLKGGRARFINPGALNAWGGASGLVRLDYNWGVARVILEDIRAGLKKPPV